MEQAVVAVLEADPEEEAAAVAAAVLWRELAVLREEAELKPSATACSSH